MPTGRIAYFVSPHGFGHAARSAAVMEALGRLDVNLAFDVVTTVPKWFFAQSLSVSHRMVPILSDVGLVQIDPMREDVGATIQALEEYWSGLGTTAEKLIRDWGEDTPRCVVSDISPLGLEVARRLEVPSVLVENFTWDWIYSAYVDDAPRLVEFSERSAELTSTATLHVQCDPACRPVDLGTPVAPVSRTARNGRRATRRVLGLSATDERPLILLTMGGLGWGSAAPESHDDYFLVALGGTDRLTRNSSTLHLPNQSPVFPPDLVSAADVVIGKLGYSTVAECYRAGARLGYFTRPRFPESPVLEAFVRRHLPSLDLTAETADAPERHRQVQRLLSLPRGTPLDGNGSDEVAKLIVSQL